MMIVPNKNKRRRSSSSFPPSTTSACARVGGVAAMCASSQHAFARPNHDATAPTPSHKKNTINRYSQPPCPKEGQTVYDCQTVTGNSLRVLRNDMLQVNRAGGYFAVGGGGGGATPGARCCCCATTQHHQRPIVPTNDTNTNQQGLQKAQDNLVCVFFCFVVCAALTGAAEGAARAAFVCVCANAHALFFAATFFST